MTYPPQGQPPYQGPYPPQGQPPGYYPPPGYPPPVVVQVYPRQMVSRQRMSFGASAFHWFMIISTGGLWLPVYLSARRKRKTVTTWS
jgi:hypothetical protein